MSFGQQHFGSAQLGDIRRTRRLVYTADCMHARSAGTLPDKLPDPYDLDAFYRLLDADAVTHDTVLKPHLDRTHTLVADEPVVLMLHDTTILDYSGLRSAADELGPIGNGHGRGLLCHNVLAVTPTRQVLGLAAQLLHVPRRASDKQTKAQARLDLASQSRIWRDALHKTPKPAPGKRIVHIADRGADITEFLDGMDERQDEFIVRSKTNRAILVAPNASPPLKLHDFARTLPAQGSQTVSVRHQKHTQSREAQCVCSAAKVTIKPPRQARGRERQVPLEMHCVRVWEPNPPVGVKALEWFLLTNIACDTPEQTWCVVGWYSRRMMIEDYHKAMKTGCGIETLQLTTRARLEPAIAVLSVIALSLLALRDMARDESKRDEAAGDYWPAMWIVVLMRWRYKGRKVKVQWSVKDMIMALGRLGGHQNKPSDGLPGWQTLWRGWRRLMDMVEGVRWWDTDED